MTIHLFDLSVAIAAAIVVCAPAYFLKSKQARLGLVGGALLVFILALWGSSEFLYPRFATWQFEYQLKSQPIFKTIAKYHPEAFDAFAQSLAKDPRRHEADYTAYRSAEFVNSIFFQHLAVSRDDYIEVYLKAILALYEYLKNASPETVLILENIKVSSPSLVNVWEQKTFQQLLGRVLDAKQYIIESSVKTPYTPSQENTAQQVITDVLKGVNQQFLPGIVKQVFSPAVSSIPPAMAATVIIEFYKLLLASGKENAGMVVRYMAALKVESMKASSEHKAE